MRGMDPLFDEYDAHERGCARCSRAKVDTFTRYCGDGDRLLDAIAAKYQLTRPPYHPDAK